ncbi:MAG: outer membrane protein insertion porin family, partial [Nitrospinales bacterium]
NNRMRLEKYLQGEGFFNVKVVVDTTIKKQQVNIAYKVYPGNPLRFRNVVFPSDSTKIDRLIFSSKSKSVLKKGEQFNTKNILRERARLAQIANNNGFLNIGKNDFLFYLDTLKGQALSDVFIKIKPRTDSLEHQPYHLNQTWIFQNYSLILQDSLQSEDTLNYEGLQIVQQDQFLTQETLARSILQRKDDLYSKTLNEYTLARLLDLNVYKFVNIKYREHQDTVKLTTDRFIYLTPGDTRDISAEIKANTREGNFLGSGLKLAYTDRNIFGGAERFESSISGAVETQFGDDGPLINTGEAGIELKLLLPYFFPFKNRKSERLFTPKTNINLAFNFEKRLEFYTLNSFSLQYGYSWRATLRKQHQFLPIVINRINLLEKTKALEDILEENPSLRSSFENVYIAGMQYIFTQSSKKVNSQESYYYFRANIESSGNGAFLLNRITKGKQDEPYSFLGLPFAQYIKNDFDFRYYIPLKTSTLITRLFAGTGYAYGNQKVMPYVKQYYSGGSNGLRAFPIRTVGPGSYLNPQIDTDENEFIDQTGDIKLEGNLEYRFGIVGYLKGALFLDAGNIWLMRDENDAREGGLFKFNEFYDEIAIGTGLGFRLDINSFILRLDLAFPLSKPFLPQGERWVADKIALGDKNWRKENLVWNLALGYPF